MRNVTLGGRGQQILFPLRPSFLCQSRGFPWIDTLEFTQTPRASSKDDKGRCFHSGKSSALAWLCGQAWAQHTSYLTGERVTLFTALGYPSSWAGWNESPEAMWPLTENHSVSQPNVGRQRGNGSEEHAFLALVSPEIRTSKINIAFIWWPHRTAQHLKVLPSQTMPEMWTKVWPLCSLSKAQL